VVVELVQEQAQHMVYQLDMVLVEEQVPYMDDLLDTVLVVEQVQELVSEQLQVELYVGQVRRHVVPYFEHKVVVLAQV
jgi:hypothetical protein